MTRKQLMTTLRLALAVAAVSLAAHQTVRAQEPEKSPNAPKRPAESRMRSTTQAQRKAARLRQAPQQTGVSAVYAGLDRSTAAFSPLTTGNLPLAEMGTPMATPDYFGVANWANSPLPQLDPVSGAVIPGTGIRKFVDTLPGLCGMPGATNDLGQCIPVAAPDTSSFPGSDFYRIGLTDYSQQMHLDLPATTLRGYVQLDSAGNPVYDPGTGTQQYLGPMILATRNRPVRILFNNQLASDLFIPVDPTYMGAGDVDDGSHMAMASEKRAVIHLHGGNTPWISDGTPHQWVTPAGGDGQPDAKGFAKGFSFQNVPDMASLVGAPNPDGTPNRTDGLATYYWTNQQSGRLMFYHDHAYGITRLNVYAGEAAGYLIVDPVQEAALQAATVPGTIVTDPATGAVVSQDFAHLLPLVIQDKTFVPDNGDPGGQLAATDPTWDVTQFGGAGSLWFPHVYMPNQNPSDLSGANAYGRWDYGPWFWPPQDPSTFVPQGQPYSCQSAAYPGQWLMCPGTPNPSGTPEAFMDTPVINGTAYPSLAVEPTAYRFQILNAANDRAWNLGLYYAATATGTLCIGGAVADLSTCTEVSMVPAVPHSSTTAVPLCATATQTGGGGLAIADLVSGSPANGTGLPAGCWPTTWPTDGRDGGVPDPATAGPPIIQIGAEGGLLPSPAVIPSTPMGFEYNRRSITVLNVFSHGLVMGPAERADVVVDFSSVPDGSVLILYNDGPAPVPAFDPRIDYYTGDPDQTMTGGAPSTLPGYGPNTRTLMQIKVTGTTAPTFSLASLQAAQPAAFAATQDPVIVPEPDYPVGNGNAAQGNYVRIQDTSFPFYNGGSIGGLTLIRGGGGYVTPPGVIISGGGGSGATASATLAPTSVASVTRVNAGSGYTSPPTVTLSGGGGSGATATAQLAATTVASATVTAGGSGYTSPPTVTIAPPAGGGVQATAHATVRSNGQRNVTGVIIDNHGSGYTSVPAITFSGGGGSGAAARANLAATSVASVTLTNGGTGYSSAPTVAFSGGGGSGATATAALAPSSVASLTLLTGGTGYTSAPSVSIAAPPAGPTAIAVATAPTVPLLPKTIQELFTLDYGRMNATLGVELPFTNFLTQTTIPYGYVDPPTEIFKDNETQLWKITHNGVDTHFIHFHLFTVQVINRVGWDGAIKPPDPNELGFKDTVRMNPLEDIIVALRPMKQQGLPWQLPNSVRPLDVTMPVGSAVANEFTNVDPANQPAVVTNDLTNFGWEYVWHCHILGHEENDMMRPMSFAVPPEAPSGLAAAVPSGSPRVILTWADNSLNETGFTIARAEVIGGVPGAFTTIATVGPNVLTYTDTTVSRNHNYLYRVTANNMVGYTQTYAAPAVGYPHLSADSAPTQLASAVTP